MCELHHDHHLKVVFEQVETGNELCFMCAVRSVVSGKHVFTRVEEADRVASEKCDECKGTV